MIDLYEELKLTLIEDQIASGIYPYIKRHSIRDSRLDSWSAFSTFLARLLYHHRKTRPNMLMLLKRPFLDI